MGNSWEGVLRHSSDSPSTAGRRPRSRRDRSSRRAGRRGLPWTVMPNVLRAHAVGAAGRERARTDGAPDRRRRPASAGVKRFRHCARLRAPRAGPHRSTAGEPGRAARTTTRRSRARAIKAAQSRGFTLAEIHELVDLSAHRRGTDELRSRATAKIAEVDERIRAVARDARGPRERHPRPNAIR